AAKRGETKLQEGPEDRARRSLWGVASHALSWRPMPGNCLRIRPCAGIGAAMPQDQGFTSWPGARGRRCRMNALEVERAPDVGFVSDQGRRIVPPNRMHFPKPLAFASLRPGNAGVPERAGVAWLTLP